MTDVTFPTCVVTTASGPFTVICEPISDALAITPYFGTDDDDNPILGGDFVITHRATGMIVSDGPGCIQCCRSAGKALTAIGVDWDSLSPESVGELPADVRRAVAEARTVNWSCDAEYCEPWPEGAAAERTESRANHLKQNARLVAAAEAQ